MAALVRAMPEPSAAARGRTARRGHGGGFAGVVRRLALARAGDVADRRGPRGRVDRARTGRRGGRGGGLGRAAGKVAAETATPAAAGRARRRRGGRRRAAGPARAAPFGFGARSTRQPPAAPARQDGPWRRTRDGQPRDSSTRRAPGSAVGRAAAAGDAHGARLRGRRRQPRPAAARAEASGRWPQADRRAPAEAAAGDARPRVARAARGEARWRQCEESVAVPPPPPRPPSRRRAPARSADRIDVPGEPQPPRRGA